MKIVESPAYHSLTMALDTSSNSTSLFIYDNSLTAQQVPADSSWVLEYVHDQSNPGVSKAYNEGFKKAKAEGKKWLLLVDQDTFFPPNAFAEYEKVVAEGRHAIVVPVLQDQFGIVSPFKFRWGGGQRLRSIEKTSRLTLRDNFFINSGAMISNDCFESAGGYDEQFSLDFSDLVFNHRLRRLCHEFGLIDMPCKHCLSSEANSFTETLIRFRNYLTASKLYGKLYGGSFFLFCARFSRAAKLSSKFFSLQFMLLFFRLEKQQSSA